MFVAPGTLEGMTAVFLTDAPPVLAEWLAERRRLGQDRRDEIWEGVLHVAPYASGEHSQLEIQIAITLHRLATAAGLHASSGFNLGEPGDHRVPDLGVHTVAPRGVWFATAAVVVEIVSPGDETFKKFGFYAEHGVDEVFVVDGPSRAVRMWQLVQGEYVETGRSGLLAVTGVDVAAELDWP